MTDSQMDAVTAGGNQTGHGSQAQDSNSFNSCGAGACVSTGFTGNQGSNGKSVGNATNE
jgi:hypothetical protein